MLSSFTHGIEKKTQTQKFLIFDSIVRNCTQLVQQNYKSDSSELEEELKLWICYCQPFGCVGCIFATQKLK